MRVALETQSDFAGDDLPAALASCWHLLTRAVHDRHQPLHILALATVDEQHQPQLRNVVLRAADAAAGSIRFHTDRRAPKFSQLQARPAAALLGYDAPRQLQLRLEGSASLHLSDLPADVAWQQSTPSSRACYRSMVAPSQLLSAPAGWAENPPPDSMAEQAGREHFAVVVVRVTALEWLWLCHRGHRRARYVRRDDVFIGEWLAP